MPFPKLKFLRLLIGLPILVLGTCLPLIDFWPWFFYIAGCIIALVGGYILTRIFDYSLSGIGFVLVGFPVFLFSMRPNAFESLAQFSADPPTILITRFAACLFGIICLFASFHEDKW